MLYIYLIKNHSKNYTIVLTKLISRGKFISMTGELLPKSRQRGHYDRNFGSPSWVLVVVLGFICRWKHKKRLSSNIYLVEWFRMVLLLLRTARSNTLADYDVIIISIDTSFVPTSLSLVSFPGYKTYQQYLFSTRVLFPPP